MKRRWPLLLLLFCWLLILLAPSLRQMFWIQVSGQSNFYGGLSYGPFPRHRVRPLPGSAPDWEIVKSRFPDDSRVLAVEADNVEGEAEGLQMYYRKRTRAYDALIQRFPKEKWLIARRLTHSIGWMFTERRGGEFDDANEARIAQHKSPERIGKPNYTPQDLNAAIAMARLGQARNPDNAFYDYALFYFLMMGWRDKEAWPVLAKGSHKPRYDMHGREWMEAQLAIRELKWGRPLLWEEFFLVQSVLLFSHLSRERGMGRIVKWEGVKAERRGDHKKALQIYTDMARIQALHAKGSYFGIEATVAYAMMVQATNIEGRVEPKEMTPQQWESFEARAKLSAYKFARYATKHGRPDLAHEMSRLRIQTGRNQDRLATKRNSQIFHWPGFESRLLIYLISSWWAATIFLLALVFLLILFIALGMMLRWANVPIIELARRDVFLLTFCSVLSIILCMSVALYNGVGWRSEFFIGVERGTLDAPQSGSPLLYSLLLMGALSPAWLATLLCMPLTARHERLSANKTPHVRTSVFRESSLRHQFANLRLMAIPGWLLSFLQLAAPFWVIGFFTNLSIRLPLPNGDWFLDINQFSPLWSEVIFVFATLLFPLRWLLFTAPDDKPRAVYRLRLLQSTLGALLIIGSVAYLLLLVASIPLRARADAQMNKLIERGEVALMLENYSAVPKTK